MLKSKLLFILFLFTIVNLTFAQSKILIDEDFSSNHYNWPESSDDDLVRKLKRGKYILRSKNSFGYWALASTNYVGDKENFVLETSIKLVSGPTDQGYGVIFGVYSNDSDYKTFYIANTGYFKLCSYHSETSHDVTDWIKCDKIVSGENILKIIRNYNCLSFYINGSLVYNYYQFKWYGSKFGIRVGVSQEIEVDYFKLTTTPKPLPTYDVEMTKYKKENLGPAINSKYGELSPCVAPDGNTIYFVKDNCPENTGNDPTKQDAYFSSLNPDSTWGKYKNLGSPINNLGSNFIISVSPDNNTLVVANTYKPNGEADGQGMSIAHRQKDNTWSIPVKQEIIDFKNVNKFVGYFISADNTVLISSLENDDSFGDLDLFVSFLLDDGRWSKPTNIGSVINTSGAEFKPFLASDGKTLYFSSYGHESFGSADIFKTTRLDDTWKNWSKPINLGPSINTENWESGFTIAAKGDYAYMVSSDGGIEKSTDIFRIKLAQTQKPQPVVLISGKVIDNKTKKPLEANISYFDLKVNKEVGKAKSSPSDGSYKIVLPSGKDYGFKAIVDGYYSISEHLQLDTLKEYVELSRELSLTPVEVGTTIRLNNIFFDNNKSTLKSASFLELDQLYKFLNTNPNVSIEIMGHTDDVGSDDYNLKLSQGRSESVMNYLVEKGISVNRLTAKGYGESKPIDKNDSEEGRSKNRRVEFSILSK